MMGCFWLQNVCHSSGAQFTNFWVSCPFKNNKVLSRDVLCQVHKSTPESLQMRKTVNNVFRFLYWSSFAHQGTDGHRAGHRRCFHIWLSKERSISQNIQTLHISWDLSFLRRWSALVKRRLLSGFIFLKERCEVMCVCGVVGGWESIWPWAVLCPTDL